MNFDVNNKLADAGLAAGERLTLLAALELADEHGEVSASQAEIAQAARMSLATSSAALRRARDLGLIREVEAPYPQQRKPARLSLRPILGGRDRRGRP